MSSFEETRKKRSQLIDLMKEVYGKDYTFGWLYGAYVYNPDIDRSDRISHQLRDHVPGAFTGWIYQFLFFEKDHIARSGSAADHP